MRSCLTIWTACLVTLLPAWLNTSEPARAAAAMERSQGQGLSVEPRTPSNGKGFDFKCQLGSSTAVLSIDPLGASHTDSASLSSPEGSISLSAKFEQGTRTIVITAKRSGTEIGRYSWRVSASLE